MTLKITQTKPSDSTKHTTGNIDASTIDTDLEASSAVHYVMELTTASRTLTLPTPSSSYLASEVTLTCKTPSSGKATIGCTTTAGIHDLDNDLIGPVGLDDKTVVTARCHEYSTGNFRWEFYRSSQKPDTPPVVTREVITLDATNISTSTGGLIENHDVVLLADTGTGSSYLTQNNYNSPSLTLSTYSTATDTKTLRFTNGTVPRLYHYDISMVLETSDGAFDIESALLHVKKQSFVIDKDVKSAVGGNYDRVFLKASGVIALGNSNYLEITAATKGNQAAIKGDYIYINVTEVSTY